MSFWSKVMEGRNGIDNLNMALLVLVLLCNLLTKLFFLPILAVASLFILTIGLYRTFSKHLAARKKEEDWLNSQIGKITELFGKK